MRDNVQREYLNIAVYVALVSRIETKLVLKSPLNSVKVSLSFIPGLLRTIHHVAEHVASLEYLLQFCTWRLLLNTVINPKTNPNPNTNPNANLNTSPNPNTNPNLSLILTLSLEREVL